MGPSILTPRQGLDIQDETISLVCGQGFKYWHLERIFLNEEFG